MPGDVKWIKIVTDIFDDEKVLLIETLPEADSIIVIWFKLLCLAGKQNNSGVFVMGNGIAYTDKMLATIFRRKDTIVALALNTFEKFGMIEIIDNVVTIPKWGKHQTLDKIELKNEYQRQYMREYRSRQTLLAQGFAECKTNGKTNSKVNVSSSEEEGEEELEIEGDRENGESGASDDASPSGKPKGRKKFGEYGWIRLNDEEYNRLITEYGEETTSRYIGVVDELAQQTGNKNKWKDWNLTVRKAIRDQWGTNRGKRADEEKPDYSDPSRYVGISMDV